jgi:DNA-binding NarL/FixJ family response regulator
MNSEEPAQPAARRSVLIVDDDPHVCTSLTMLLRISGEWQVVGAVADQVSALEYAAALLPDLVLLDLWLAEGASLPLLPDLLALQPPPTVVLLSAEQSITIREQALALGARRFLDKLQIHGTLLEELRKLSNEG